MRKSVPTKILEFAIRAVVLVLLGLLVARQLDAFTKNDPLDPSLMRPAKGYSYLLVLPTSWGAEVLYPSDSMDNPSISSSILLENKHALGPPHSGHQEIAEKGGGRFSHWNGGLLFSTSDNSDPRTNRRNYSLQSRPAIASITFLPLLLLAVLVIAHRRISDIPEVALAQRIFRDVRISNTLVFAALCALQTWSLIQDGTHEYPDTGLYVAAADAFISGEAWTFASVGPGTDPTLFRVPGYPIVIALLKLVAGDHWKPALYGFQMAISVLAGFILYRSVARVGKNRILALALTAVWAIALREKWDRALLSDSLTISISTIVISQLALLAIEKRDLRYIECALIGLAFAGLSLLREMNALIVVCTVPLLLCAVGRKAFVRIVPHLTLAYMPMVFAILAVFAWNYGRTGQIVFTSGSGTALLLPLVEADQQSQAIFTQDTLLDRVARARVQSDGWSDTKRIYSELVANHNMTTVQIANLARSRYLYEWYNNTKIMMEKTLGRLPVLVNVMLPQDALGMPYNIFVTVLFFSCVTLFPIFLSVFALLFQESQRELAIVASLLFICIGPSIAYAAIHLEVRYVLFTIAPLLVVFALSVRALLARGQANRSCSANRYR
ncbi:hypothetical protein SAZ10_04200 [Mesorhizobium sp. BAC0120]|uniref:hypothetical protein n=1 Tax=Mesorhizobium sp. BAC0120 TaxID=3090670 RepID=UPI00298C04FA|nr:hypothetical protein [Mesorhizobium sp. BAC0120]MDW6020959.1 hypothetical protein [Mesorhizobium sp. BAC0120]